MSDELSIEYMEPEKLSPHPGNPRNHPNSALSKLESSIESFGWTNPIIAQEDNTILAGHARLKAAKDMGKDEVPVIHVDLDGKSADAYMIADNRTQQETEWEFDDLADLMLELDDGDFDLELTGFDMDEIEDMMTWTPEPDEVEEEPVPEEPEEPVTNKGDLWILGDHRLLCGDATDEDDVERLMNGEQADMVFTDPPYALFGNSTGVSGVADDKMIQPFFRESFGMAKKKTKQFGHIYFCCDWHSVSVLQKMAESVGLEAKNLCVWDKGDGGVGAMYQQCYEFVWFFGNSPKKETVSGTEQTGEKTINGVPNIWRYQRVQKSDRDHNAAKPVKMIAEKPINNSSEKNEIVLDLFAGSGSALMASEQTKRKCYSMEMEPKYCDVIVERWENMTGQEAERMTNESLENEGESTDA